MILIFFSSWSFLRKLKSLLLISQNNFDLISRDFKSAIFYIY